MRPVGTPFLARHDEPADVSLGGSGYRNEKVRVGDLLEMEIFVPDSTPVACTGQVVWVDARPRGRTIRRGLKFVELDAAALGLLASTPGLWRSDDAGQATERVRVRDAQDDLMVLGSVRVQRLERLRHVLERQAVRHQQSGCSSPLAVRRTAA